MAHHLPLITLMKLARKAQQENDQRHDVQLEIIPEVEWGNAADGLWRKKDEDSMDAPLDSHS